MSDNPVRNCMTWRKITPLFFLLFEQTLVLFQRPAGVPNHAITHFYCIFFTNSCPERKRDFTQKRKIGHFTYSRRDSPTFIFFFTNSRRNVELFMHRAWKAFNPFTQFFSCSRIHAEKMASHKIT